MTDDVPSRGFELSAFPTEQATPWSKPGILMVMGSDALLAAGFPISERNPSRSGHQAPARAQGQGLPHHGYSPAQVQVTYPSRGSWYQAGRAAGR